MYLLNLNRLPVMSSKMPSYEPLRQNLTNLTTPPSILRAAELSFRRSDNITRSFSYTTEREAIV